MPDQMAGLKGYDFPALSWMGSCTAGTKLTAFCSSSCDPVVMWHQGRVVALPPDY